MKATLNLADPRHRARYIVGTLARYLLPLLGCWLLFLLISQGRIIYHRHQLRKELDALSSQVKTVQPEPAIQISAKDQARQEADIRFVNDIITKDQFSWIELLDRLEKTLIDGVTLMRIEPDYKERSLQLSGMAENVDALKSYLTSLLGSDTLAAAFLLRQNTQTFKDRYNREHPAIAFQIAIQKAF